MNSLLRAPVTSTGLEFTYLLNIMNTRPLSERSHWLQQLVQIVLLATFEKFDEFADWYFAVFIQVDVIK